MTRPLRIAVADGDPHTRDYYQALLSRRGHQVTLAQTGRHLVEQCQTAEMDLVITAGRLPDLDGVDAIEEISRTRPVPAIVLTSQRDPELRRRVLDGPVMAYLAQPVSELELEAANDFALRRFEQFRALRAQVTDLQQALEGRNLIERAKGALMKPLGVNEDEAFRLLRSCARDHNEKLAEAARRIIQAEAVFA
jgi:response regulator NasT